MPERDASLDSAPEYQVDSRFTCRSFISDSALVETEIATSIEQVGILADPVGGLSDYEVERTLADAVRDDSKMVWAFQRDENGNVIDTYSGDN